MRLLPVHKLLVGCAAALGAVMVLWGVLHRREDGAWTVLGLGAFSFVAGVLYSIRLKRNPPIR